MRSRTINITYISTKGGKVRDYEATVTYSYEKDGQNRWNLNLDGHSFGWVFRNQQRELIGYAANSAYYAKDADILELCDSHPDHHADSLAGEIVAQDETLDYTVDSILTELIRRGAKVTEAIDLRPV